MSWIWSFLTSSIGKKLIMSLTGLFLCLFLVIHMAGNLQLLASDGCIFNQYAYEMTTNPLIKVVSYVTYFFILLHAVQGLALAAKNRKARSVKYAVKPKGASWASNNMALLGIVIAFFLVVHLKDFWFVYKFGGLPEAVECGGMKLKDLYSIVVAAFSNLWYVVLYLVSLIVLAFHLNHGFQSAFQSLGLNHKKYTPLIKGIGLLYSILIPLGFAIQPIYIYMQSLN